MSANITFAQGATTQQGTLDSGVIASLVTLSNFSNTGVLAWRWVMVDKPEGSAATLATPSSDTCTFTPDLPGTYLIQLRTYSDASANTLDAADQQALGVNHVAPLPWRLPAAGETLEFGSRGWAKGVNGILNDVRTALNAGAGPDLIEEFTASNFSPVLITPPTDTLVSHSITDVAGAERPIVRIANTGFASAVSGICFYQITPSAPLPDRFSLEFYVALTPGAPLVGSPVLSFGLLNADDPASTLYIAGVVDPQLFVAAAGGFAIIEQFYAGDPISFQEGQINVDFETAEIDSVVTAPKVMLSWTGQGNFEAAVDPNLVTVDKAGGSENQSVLFQTSRLAMAARTSQKAAGWNAAWDGKNMRQLTFGIQNLSPGSSTISYDFLGFRLLKHPRDR